MLHHVSPTVKDTDQIKILVKICDAYQKKNEFDSSLIYAHRAIALSETLNSEKGLAESYYMLGTCLYKKQDYDEARKVFQKSFTKFVKLKNLQKMAAIATHMGFCAEIKGQFALALKFYSLNYQTNVFLNNKSKQCNSLNNIGTIYEVLGQYSKALETQYKSLAIATELNNTNAISQSNNNIANIYSLQKDYSKAIEFYNKALEIDKIENNPASMLESLTNIAIVYSAAADFKKAEDYFKQALQRIVKDDYEYEHSVILYNMGALYIQMKDYEKARDCFKTSISFSESLGDAIQVAYSFSSYGKLNYYEKKYPDAEEMYLKSLKVAEESEVGELKVQIYQDLSDLYTTIKEHDKALEMYKKYIVERDIQNLDDSKRVAELQEVKFSFDREKIQYEKEQEKKTLLIEEEKKMQKIFSYSVATILVLTLIFFVFLYNRYKLTQKQKAIISQQKHEVELQKHIVDEKQKEIVDSINYAQRIQYALLANKKLLDDNLPEYFLYFQPKDVVSGDFYWAQKLSNGTFAVVTADSTGHGVPGAIMSILNIACLNESIKADKLTKPADILNATRVKVINHLMHDGSTEGGKDGMDCSLISFDFKHLKLVYAAANNPVWIVRDNKLIALPADKMPIGKHDKDAVPFKQTEVELQKGDVVYAFTDGYADQFGGIKGKKFKYKQLEELLLSIYTKPMLVQHDFLRQSFNDWKGNLEQVDDVCVIGVRV
ncbi:MAG: tetratricopeptide repeat protein [Bacteroidota bacterium]